MLVQNVEVDISLKHGYFVMRQNNVKRSRNLKHYSFMTRFTAFLSMSPGMNLSALKMNTCGQIILTEKTSGCPKVPRVVGILCSLKIGIYYVRCT